jgi:hypothetical protein
MGLQFWQLRGWSKTISKIAFFLSRSFFCFLDDDKTLKALKRNKFEIT